MVRQNIITLLSRALRPNQPLERTPPRCGAAQRHVLRQRNKMGVASCNRTLLLDLGARVVSSEAVCGRRAGSHERQLREADRSICLLGGGADEAFERNS